MSEKEHRIQEYLEAARACRNGDDMTRTAFRFYILVALAIVAGLIYKPDSKLGPLINVAGLLIGVMTMNIMWRLQIYYRSYMSRANEIEKELGYYLYRRAQRQFSNSVGSVVTLSNKTAMIVAVAIPTFYFFYQSLVQLWALSVGSALMGVFLFLLWLDWACIHALANRDT